MSFASKILYWLNVSSVTETFITVVPKLEKILFSLAYFMVSASIIWNIFLQLILHIILYMFTSNCLMLEIILPNNLFIDVSVNYTVNHEVTC